MEHAVEVKQRFVDAPGKAARVCLVFQDVTSADLSVLQLICAAHRAAVAANQIMTLDLDGAGATGWIVKPFKPEQLLAVVKKVLG